MVRREAFAAAGGFDPSLRAGEDWDFCLRLRDRGWLPWFDPGVEVAHDHRRGGILRILRQAHDSGRLSGLKVQQRHRAHLTPVGRLSLAGGTPGRYAGLIVPLAMLNTAMQVLPGVCRQPRILLFSPLVFMARLAYHVGVWRHLARPADV